MTAIEPKNTRLSIHLTRSDSAMIDRAAGLQGCSRIDFVHDAAVRAAGEGVMENRLVRMSPEGFAGFMETLTHPAAPVPGMVELVKRPAPWETGCVAKR